MSEKVKNAVNYDAVMRRELEKRKAEEEMGAARARLLLAQLLRAVFFGVSGNFKGFFKRYGVLL